MMSSATWMISVGIGLYFGYVPVNCVLFDRLIAAVGKVATAGFLIYVADASGYLARGAPAVQELRPAGPVVAAVLHVLQLRDVGAVRGVLRLSAVFHRVAQREAA